MIALSIISEPEGWRWRRERQREREREREREERKTNQSQSVTTCYYMINMDYGVKNITEGQRSDGSICHV